MWRAEHLTLRSPVAIKVMDASIAATKEGSARFLREAQAAASLRSTHVVQIFDYGVDEGVPYIVMELLEGESLQDRLERVRTLSPPEVARIFLEVGRAMEKAHEAGIVHRDLKPDNIFIVHEGDRELTKVLDFGIAKVTNVGTDSGQMNLATLTADAGALLGTPHYMSPEQAQGNKTIDRRTDTWAMAVIAYRCLTGRLPFQSSAVGDIIIKICIQPLPVPSKIAPVPDGFDEWFAKGVSRDADARFQSARELAETLHKVLLGSEARLSGLLDAASSVSSVSNSSVSRSVPVQTGSETIAGNDLPERWLTTGHAAASERTVIPTSTSEGHTKMLVLIAGGLVGAIVGAGVLWATTASHGDDAASPASAAPASSAAKSATETKQAAPPAEPHVISPPAETAPTAAPPEAAQPPAQSPPATATRSSSPATTTKHPKTATARPRTAPSATATATATATYNNPLGSRK